MKLDIRNNELVFREIENKRNFLNALHRIKGIKYRDAYSVVYISLEFFNEVREILQLFKPFLVTKQYELFAQRFVTNPNTIHITWNPAECSIEGTGMPWRDIIPATRYFNKAALNSTAYTKQHWDGNNHLIDVIKGTFPSGLMERITNILTEQNIPFEVTRTFDYPAPYLQWNPVFSFIPTQDQVLAVEALAKANRGIAKLPTGFGKTSYVAASLIAKKGVKSLFLANQRILINDAKRDFESVFTGEKIGVIGDGEFDVDRPITVASIQGIVAALNTPTKAELDQLAFSIKNAELLQDETLVKKAKTKWQKANDKIQKAKLLQHYLNSVELFVVDESQVLGTQMWDTFLYACPAPYRYTLSATDTRSDGGRILIVAATGERVYESSAAEQIEKGRLSEFKGKFVRFDHKIPKTLARQIQISFHEAYNIFIMNNQSRNNHLCDVVIDYCHKGFSVIALVTRIDHAEIIKTMLEHKGVSPEHCRIVTGSTPKKQREAIIEDFRNGQFPILIGSSIFDVGFNAKNAARMVRFNAGASEIKEPQRAGRTVRMREDGSHGETYDVYDVNVPFFEYQAKKRVTALQEEFGKQRVEILPKKIEGELNVAPLKEVAQQIPDVSERKKMDEIIQHLSKITEAERLPERHEKVDADLKSLLDNLGLW